MMFFALVACRQELTPEEKQQVTELKAELILIQNDIKETQAKDEKIIGGLVKALLAVHLEQAQITENLIKQQILALETGAKVDIRSIQSSPDPALADQLAKEIEDIQTKIIAARKEAEKYSGGLVLATLTTQITTHELTMATLQQRRLAAKYGLNYPLYSNTAIALSDSAKTTNDEDAPEEQTKQEPSLTENSNDSGLITIQQLAESRKGGHDIIGNWVVIKEKASALGDATDVRIVNIAPVFHDGHWTSARKKQQAVLVVQCANNKTEIAVLFQTMVGGLYNVNVEYKIDDKKIVKAKWGRTSDHQGASAPKPIQFIRELFSAKKLALRANLFDSTAVTETYFKIDGLEEAIKPIQEACKWQ